VGLEAVSLGGGSRSIAYVEALSRTVRIRRISSPSRTSSQAR